MYVTLIVTPSWNLQMVVYLELMAVWGRENSGRVFLWLVPNIKVSVTASYVMKKCQTGVFKSVFCDARESMYFRHDGRCLRDNAVSSYFLKIPHFTLVLKPKVLNNNVQNIYSVSPKLCVFIMLRTSYVPIYTMFLS